MLLAKSVKRCKLLLSDIGYCKWITRKYAEKQRIQIIDELEHVKCDPKAQRLYIWGLAEHGALGELKVRSKKQNIPRISRPIRYSFAYSHNIIDADCGNGFTLYAVDNKNQYKLFGCGLNTDSQIGYHDPRRGHPVGQIASIVQIKLPLNNQNTKVIKVAAGRAHSLILTDREGIFALGNNNYGQCGRIPSPNEDTLKHGYHHIRRIKQLDKERISDVHCGQDHSLFQTESGKIYSCGWGADGQTGLGHYNTSHIPTLVEGDIKDENIVKISTTTDTVLALNDKGEVFGWGNSEYFQLLTVETLTQLSVPKHLKHLKNLGKIVDIASGGTFSMVLNEEGDVFVWGFGPLGKGPTAEYSDKPTKIPPILFGRNEFNPDTRIKNISCGISSMMAITNGGELYAWGRNKHGQLGIGHCEDQYFPMKVSVGATVEKVWCGLDHTIALCTTFG